MSSITSLVASGWIAAVLFCPATGIAQDKTAACRYRFTVAETSAQDGKPNWPLDAQTWWARQGQKKHPQLCEAAPAHAEFLIVWRRTVTFQTHQRPKTPLAQQTSATDCYTMPADTSCHVEGGELICTPVPARTFCSPVPAAPARDWGNRQTHHHRNQRGPGEADTVRGGSASGDAGCAEGARGGGGTTTSRPAAA